MITRRTPIMGNGSRKMPANTRQNRGPLPGMSRSRAPQSRPLTVRSAISQGIARRRVGNLPVDQKKKSARPLLSKATAHSPLLSVSTKPAIDQRWDRGSGIGQGGFDQAVVRRQRADRIGARRVTGQRQRLA